MTICIAALCENGAGCILASDKMVTVHFPMGYEFENEEVKKIVEIEHSGPAYVIISGDIIFADEVIEKAKQTIIAEKITSTASIVEAIRTAYQLIRREMVVQSRLEPLGFTLSTFTENQQKLQAQVVLSIHQAFQTHNPGVEFVVAGKDEDSSHIYIIRNPGLKACYDTIGYVAIGSGGPHATYQFLDSEYRKSMKKKEVLEIVKLAKERSEKAPGVGRGTQITEIGGVTHD